MEFRPNREILAESRYEAFHLEVRDEYGVPSEDEPFQRFLNNEPFDYREWYKSWSGFVKELTARGVSFRRVRVVTVPHSDYHRWSLAMAAFNEEAGEDIRYLPRRLAGEVPKDDWWLIDNEAVAFNLTGMDGRAVGSSAVSTDPGIVSYCRSIRDRLWALATPSSEYARVTSRQ
ncbi:hypothetical protein OHA40_13580 [Nocardia sp. NBC_00508]|uniref:DUF6879 family protein n=1 Tax=Nocardia sp. NBC_00508 TaxID=2975992 RepID=UPI002E8126DF|nr:DUF6879 family protein [Nocardia sp. NBC_00508]WUD69059.1 hypothetical protein OHA40_13580 [Nocardia sp. NBC_00508]